jgi:hypothetical protein
MTRLKAISLFLIAILVLMSLVIAQVSPVGSVIPAAVGGIYFHTVDNDTPIAPDIIVCGGCSGGGPV